jgi:hypothetical protein
MIGPLLPAALLGAHARNQAIQEKPSQTNRPERAEHHWKCRVLPKLAVSLNYSIKFAEKFVGKCRRGAACFVLWAKNDGHLLSGG